METSLDRAEPGWTGVRIASRFAVRCVPGEPLGLTGWSERGVGAVVTDHRSSWVRRTRFHEIDAYIKTYDYPTTGARWRGAGRNTWLAPSRARREWEALCWLRAGGFDAPEPLVLGEQRTGLGFLRRAVLITSAWDGRSLADLWPGLAAGARATVAAALRETVSRLHTAGFIHGNLDLRNVIAREEGGTWRLAVIDAPRHHLTRRGRPAPARRARRDRARLAGSLHAAGATAAEIAIAVPARGAPAG